MAPNARQNAASRSVASGLGALGRRQDAPAVDEQLGEAGVGAGVFGAGDGMRGHEVDAGGQVRRHVANDRAFDRADVGDDGAGLEMRADLGRDRAAGADRDADDHEVGVLRRFGVGGDDLVGEAELDHALARRFRARGRDDLLHDALLARGARDRGADQADADQRQAIEQGLRHVRPITCAP